MKSFSEQMASIVKTRSLLITRGPISDNEDGTPPLSIGMIVPLFWSGRTTRCGVLRSRSYATERRWGG